MKPKIGMAGKGFIGDEVSRQLKKLGYEVEIISLSLGQDVTKQDVVEEFVKRNDIIIQMAAIADLNDFEKTPLLGMNVNVWATVLFANYCTKYKKRLYYISTCCAYGNAEDLPSNEKSRCNPSEIYAEAKLAGEHIIHGYHKSFDLEYVILRIATTYGPEMRSSLAPAVFIAQMLSGKPVTIHGTGSQTRTLTYIEDEADGIVAAIEHPEVVNETINISSEESLSVYEWVEVIGKVLGVNPVIKFIEDRKGQTFQEEIDASKARELLGWKAKYTFEGGIRKTHEWLKEVWHGKWEDKTE